MWDRKTANTANGFSWRNFADNYLFIILLAEIWYLSVRTICNKNIFATGASKPWFMVDLLLLFKFDSCPVSDSRLRPMHCCGSAGARRTTQRLSLIPSVKINSIASNFDDLNCTEKINSKELPLKYAPSPKIKRRNAWLSLMCLSNQPPRHWERTAAHTAKQKANK